MGLRREDMTEEQYLLCCQRMQKMRDIAQANRDFKHEQQEIERKVRKRIARAKLKSDIKRHRAWSAEYKG